MPSASWVCRTCVTSPRIDLSASVTRCTDRSESRMIAAAPAAVTTFPIVAIAGEMESSAIAAAGFDFRGRSQFGHKMPCEIAVPHRMQLLAMGSGYKSYIRWDRHGQEAARPFPCFNRHDGHALP